MALSFLTAVGSDNSSVLWRFINKEHQRLDTILLALLSTKDKIFQVIRSMLTLTNLQFVGYSFLFVVVSSWALAFILPLLTLSFIFSGLVVLFTGASYTSFRLASAKYNSVVLFLNKLLRKVADNVPPSVGFVEVPNKPANLPKIPTLDIKTKINNLSEFIKSFNKDRLPNVKTNGKFEVKQADVNTPLQVIHDEDVTLENQPPEPVSSPGTLININGEASESDPVKSSELNNN